MFRFVCGSVDPGSVQAGVALRTLLGCGAAASTNKLLVLEQIQGSLTGSDGPPGIGETLLSDSDVLRRLRDSTGDGAPTAANLRRLDRTRYGGGDFVKSFPDLPDAERRTSAEIDAAFEMDVQGKIKVKKALFEDAQDAIIGAFVRSASSIGERSTSKVATSSSSSSSSSSTAEVETRAAKRHAVESVAASRNMQGIESVLGSEWQKAVDGLLRGDQVGNI